MKIPELMAPGGDLLSVKAALLGGADSVYLGLPRFNARMRAANVEDADFAELLRLAHERGRKIYVVLNILILEDELRSLYEVLDFLSGTDPDGLIVQDFGVLEILKNDYPRFSIHASTQLTTHTRRQLDALAAFGVRRANLARELDLAELEVLTAHAHSLGMETEVFVHGAYCLSYSGQCLMASFISGNSGNRGRCFQPCRWRYSRQPGGRKAPLISLRDNDALDDARRLADIGVDALKIEGRMKNYDYVYSTVTAWRRRLDTLGGKDEAAALKEAKELVRTVYNRGYTDAFLAGRLEPGIFVDDPIDRSLRRVGAVRSYSADARTLQLDTAGEARSGSSGFIFTPDNRCVCGYVLEEVLAPGTWRIRITGELDGHIEAGQLCLENPAAARMESLRLELEKMTVPLLPLDVAVRGREGETLKARFRLLPPPGSGASAGAREVEVESALPLSAARKEALGRERLLDQWGRLGGTAYRLGELDLEGLDAGLFLPLRELNAMRRLAVERLEPPASEISARRFFQEYEAAIPAPDKKPGNAGAEPGLRWAVLLDEAPDADFSRELERLGCAVFLGVEDPRRYPADSPWIPWFPAILPEALFQEYESLLSRCAAPSVVVNQTGLLVSAANLGKRIIAGPGLNVVNAASLVGLARLGVLERAVLSTELGREQVLAVCDRSRIPLLVAVFGFLRLMTVRSCLVRSFRNCPKTRMDGTCYAECRVSGTLFDSKDVPFPVLKRPWSWNEVFNNALLAIPEAASQFRRRDVTLLADLRNPGIAGFPSFDAAMLSELLAFLSEGRNEGVKPSFLEGYDLTRGNWRRNLA